MGILNFGSLNLDYVYSVDHIVLPGETIMSTSLDVFCGGKGLNQSVALARAGAKVIHAGSIGRDGDLLLQTCRENGVDTRHILTVQERTGNAIIQVNSQGQNSIVLFGGANQKNERSHIDEVLSHFAEGDIILMQNEINLLDYLIDQASQKKMWIALNPSPCNENVKDCDLTKVSLFLINEVEGEQITGQSCPEEILAAMRRKYPQADIVLTLGKRGVLYQDDTGIYRHHTYKVPVVDTTAAGDTFTGYFIAAISEKKSPQEALKIASVASSLAVSRQGAVASIPWRNEVDAANLEASVFPEPVAL